MSTSSSTRRIVSSGRTWRIPRRLARSAALTLTSKSSTKAHSPGRRSSRSTASAVDLGIRLAQTDLARQHGRVEQLQGLVAHRPRSTPHVFDSSAVRTPRSWSRRTAATMPSSIESWAKMRATRPSAATGSPPRLRSRAVSRRSNSSTPARRSRAPLRRPLRRRPRRRSRARRRVRPVRRPPPRRTRPSRRAPSSSARRRSRRRARAAPSPLYRPWPSPRVRWSRRALASAGTTVRVAAR